MDTRYYWRQPCCRSFSLPSWAPRRSHLPSMLGNVDSDGDPIPPTLEEPLIEEPLIEEPLIEVRERIGPSEANPASGSGTPYLDADGVVGASVIAGAVFGGMAGAFLRGRSGKYAAMGGG